MENILTTKDLCKNFKKQKANDNISITVRKNSIYGLLGPNGAGKSTLLKMITGMITPSSGDIYFNGIIQSMIFILIFTFLFLITLILLSNKWEGRESED